MVSVPAPEPRASDSRAPAPRESASRARERYGLIGAKLGYSYSKRIHEALYRLIGRSDLCYDLIEQPSLRLLHTYRGLNITIPYKEQVIDRLDAVDPVARAMRSVNTVVSDERGRVGYNTDILGFDALLPEDIDRFSSAVILGTGASARMAEMALRRRGVADITMVTRDADMASHDAASHDAASREAATALASAGQSPRRIITYAQLAEEARCSCDDARSGLIAESGATPDEPGAALLVNATPVGTLGNPAPLLVTASVVRRFRMVIDLVYNPPRTELLALAESEGCATANGLDMLIIQAIEANVLWGVLPQMHSHDPSARRAWLTALCRELAAAIEAERR